MKATELRIGNYVFDSKKPYCIYSGAELGNKHNENHYTPIPLTEEWLLKFRIEPQTELKEVYLYYTATDNENMILKFSVSIVDGNIEWYDKNRCVSVAKVKYIHQLQNLYFALTGEELSVS